MGTRGHDTSALGHRAVWAGAVSQLRDGAARGARGPAARLPLPGHRAGRHEHQVHRGPQPVVGISNNRISSSNSNFKTISNNSNINNYNTISTIIIDYNDLKVTIT